MAFLIVLLIAIILPQSLSQIPNRCGTDWGNANSNCGTGCTTTDAPCPSGQHCYNGLTTSCGSAPTAPAPTGSSVTGSSTRSITLADLKGFMGGASNPILTQTWVDTINQGLKDYGLNTVYGIIGFMTQVRHETAGMTIFHNSNDNGGGLIHMLPRNWKACCLATSLVASKFASYYAAKGQSCTGCACIDAMANSPSSAATADAAANLFSDPTVATYSALWWFDTGANTNLGFKGCTQKLKVYCAQGRGGGSTDCQDTGNYQLSCCIFGSTSGAASMDQRDSYYVQATNYATSAWGFKADTAEEVTLVHTTPAINAGIAIGCVVGIVAIIVVIVAVYLKRKQRIQSEVV